MQARASERDAGAGERPRRGWSLVGHVLRHPVAGWTAAAASPTGRTAMLVGIALPLTAIGPVARMAHALLFGTHAVGIIDYRPTIGGAIFVVIAGWAAAWAAVTLLAVAIDRLAPRFGGRRDAGAAARAAVIGASAWWLASALGILPHLLWLQALGLYSLVLLYLGAPRLMSVAEDRVAAFGSLVAALAAALLAVSLLLPSLLAREELRPTVRTAHGREVVRGTPAIADTRLVAPEAPARRSSATPTQQIAAAQGAADPNGLEALLPATVGPFRRTALVAQSNLSAGAATADAKGTYVAGTNSFTLTITDSGAPGALATNDSVIAGTINRVSDRGWQRSRVVNGVRVSEKWNLADHGGMYSRTVGGRFTVEAQGTAPSIDSLRLAVGSIDQARLRATAP